MRPNYAMIFMLIDAIKRLYASEFKGARTQQKAIKEYDSVRDYVRVDLPKEFEAFCTLFGVKPGATGVEILRGEQA